MARDGGIINWQWKTYDRNHRNRFNLLIHFVAVPLFIAGALYATRALFSQQWLAAGVGLICMIVGFALQAIGHKREAEKPIPFEGPLDFIGRIFIEQFITFPRFVLTGGWVRNLSQYAAKD